MSVFYHTLHRYAILFTSFLFYLPIIIHYPKSESVRDPLTPEAAPSHDRSGRSCSLSSLFPRQKNLAAVLDRIHLTPIHISLEAFERFWMFAMCDHQRICAPFPLALWLNTLPIVPHHQSQTAQSPHYHRLLSIRSGWLQSLLP